MSRKDSQLANYRTVITLLTLPQHRDNLKQIQYCVIYLTLSSLSRYLLPLHWLYWRLLIWKENVFKFANLYHKKMLGFSPCIFTNNIVRTWKKTYKMCKNICTRQKIFVWPFPPCDGSQPSRIAKWTSYKKPVGQIYTKTDWRLLLGRGEEGLVAGGENLHNIGSGQLQPGQVRGRGTLGQGSPPSSFCALTSSLDIKCLP